ncbi:unnamed protein product [Cylicocyclus nassatus]|uniref:Polycystin cation channel PKD1/PKD2 domain-containing protein n=1 Tax=Cylicocyclus nassatus TaxID=53992 RepID=A0AA36GYW8_CYLNA|nr:unnamed protein product [Cylicocyclus nassatus]
MTSVNYKDNGAYENPPNVVDATGNDSHTLSTEARIRRQDQGSHAEFSFAHQRSNHGFSWQGNRLINHIWFETLYNSERKDDGTRKVTMRSIFKMINYAVFLALISYVALAECSVQKYFFTKIIGDLFVNSKNNVNDKSFVEISSLDDIWGFLDDEFLISLYDTDANTTDREAMVYYNNKLLGRPRIRMLKASKMTKVKSFALIIICSNYHPSVENKEPLDPNNPEKSESILLDKAKQALYDAIRHPPQQPESRQIWFLLLELPASGGVLPSYRFNTYDLMRYTGSLGTVTIVLEGILCGFIVSYIIEEFFELFQIRLRYFLSFWNIVDIVLLTLCCIDIYLGYNSNTIAAARINEVLDNGLSDAAFDDVVQSQELYSDIAAVILFLAWIKNMFLAIINDSYVEVKAELARQQAGEGIFDWIRKKLTARKVPERKVATYNDYKIDLMMAGYQEKDINAAFEKLNISFTDKVDDNALIEVGNEISEQTKRKKIIDEDYRSTAVLTRRIDMMDNAILNVVDKLSQTLDQLNRIENGRVKAKEHENTLRAEALVMDAYHRGDLGGDDDSDIEREEHRQEH